MVSKMFKVCQSMTKKTDALVILQPLHVFIKLIEVKGPETSCGRFRSSWRVGCQLILGQYFPGMFAFSRTKQDKKIEVVYGFPNFNSNIFAEAGTPLKSSCLSTSNEPRSVKTSSKTSIQTPLLLTQTV